MALQMSPEQTYAMKLIFDMRRNVLLVGGCGTGKSVSIMVVAMQARKRGMNVVLLAPTWRAVMQLHDASATTLHSFFGLPLEWEALTQSRAVAACLARLRKHHKPADMANMLFIIDECSLVSKLAWTIVMKATAAFVGDNPMPQLFVVGDFVQLPPVATTDDAAEFIIQTEEFWSHITDVVVMHTRHRAIDPDLVWLLDAIHYGSVFSDDAEYARAEALLMAAANRTLPPDTMHVAGRNADVKRLVEEDAAKLGGEPFMLTSVTFNIGLKDYPRVETHMAALHSRLAKQIRTSHSLRVGQTVRLMATLNKELHNGLTGTVTRIVPREELNPTKASELVVAAAREAFAVGGGPPVVTDCAGCDQVWVRFQGQVEDTLVGDFVYTLALGTDKIPPDARIDPTSPLYPRAALVCKPLRGSIADTCHGIQGATLKSVYAHVGTMWQRGMLPMVIGRLRELSGLSLVMGTTCDLRSLLRIDDIAMAFYSIMFLAAWGKCEGLTPLPFCPSYAVESGTGIPRSQGSHVRVCSKRSITSRRAAPPKKSRKRPR